MTWATFLGFFGTMLEGLFSHPAASRNFHIGGPTKTNLSKSFCELANFFSLFFRRKIENGRKEQVLDPAADLQRARKLAHHRLALGQVLERRRLRDHCHRRRKSGWNARSKFKSFIFPPLDRPKGIRTSGLHVRSQVLCLLGCHLCSQTSLLSYFI